MKMVKMVKMVEMVEMVVLLGWYKCPFIEQGSKIEKVERKKFRKSTLKLLFYV